jgi:hypothetical protein
MRTGRAIRHRERLFTRGRARLSDRYDSIKIGDGLGTWHRGHRFSGRRSGPGDSSIDGRHRSRPVIDAVGVDATRPHDGPASKQTEAHVAEFQQEVEQIARRRTRKVRTGIRGMRHHCRFPGVWRC